ncbi:hypothetical protein KI659_16755 [Litoribacter alkaliphilus]|uniref:DUF4760 domain-containing protein n=1 Tax=Litoribacter ruber TaxID=702568 RepID=A0AAP2CLV1_9BACT|nr:hypothetical protein [Litoribacter alkaliphilus]MBS9525671.1 hypothetical protein [Litoribacter alkaliphilus]
MELKFIFEESFSSALIAITTVIQAGFIIATYFFAKKQFKNFRGNSLWERHKDMMSQSMFEFNNLVKIYLDFFELGRDKSPQNMLNLYNEFKSKLPTIITHQAQIFTYCKLADVPHVERLFQKFVDETTILHQTIQAIKHECLYCDGSGNWKIKEECNELLCLIPNDYHDFVNRDNYKMNTLILAIEDAFTFEFNKL